MKKIICSAVVFALLGCFAISGCEAVLPAAPSGTPETVPAPEAATPLPVATAAPMAEVSYNEITVYYPEGASAENAAYVLAYSLPMFPEGEPSAAAKNAAVAQYEDALLERVASERLPLSDGADGGAAGTSVECRVEAVGELVNVLFTERFTYGENEETETYALVLGPDGTRESLASAAGIYEPEALAAQQVFNIIDADRASYFGDIALDDVASALDLYEGFFITEEGFCFIVHSGMLAPEEKGELTFAVPRAAFYPAVVGDALSIEEYEALRGPLGDLVAACGMEYAGFSGGAPGAFIASAFITRRLSTGNEAGLFLPVPAAEYEALYSSFFAGAFPSDIPASGDGTFIAQTGEYMVPVYMHAAWSLRLDDAVRTDSGVMLYGMALYGEPGTSDAAELCPMTVSIAFSAASPSGFAFESVELN